MRSPRAARQGPAERSDGSFDRLRTLTQSNDDVFVGYLQTGDEHAYDYRVAFASDADPAAWADEIRAALGTHRVDVVQCDHPTRHFDRAAAEALSASWPSGAKVVRDKNLGPQVIYEFPCTVVAVLDKPTAADRAYARDRWGDTVVVRSGHAAGRP